MPGKKHNDRDGIVFSTNPDFHYDYDEPKREENTPSPHEQDLRVWLEKNQRAGKQVTLVKGFRGSAGDLQELGKLLKTKCGTGGSVKDNEIIIQGDFRDKICQLLQSLGYRVKKAGG